MEVDPRASFAAADEAGAGHPQQAAARPVRSCRIAHT